MSEVVGEIFNVITGDFVDVEGDIFFACIRSPYETLIPCDGSEQDTEHTGMRFG